MLRSPRGGVGRRLKMGPKSEESESLHRAANERARAGAAAYVLIGGSPRFVC